MKTILAVLLLLCCTALAGCNHNVTMVPECEYTTPPDAVNYLAGNTDERLVMMSTAYTDQLHKTSTCNANIKKINVKNDSLFN